MSDDSIQVTKRHQYTVNGIVAVVSAALAGFGTYVSAPKPLTIQEVKTAIAEELGPLRNELQAATVAAAEAKFDARRALNDSELVKTYVMREVPKIGDKLNLIAEACARLEERTNPRKTQ